MIMKSKLLISQLDFLFGAYGNDFKNRKILYTSKLYRN